MNDRGFAHPPDDGTREREIIDRFADYLREAGPPPCRDGVVDYEAPMVPLASRTPSQRYRMRYLIWKFDQPIPVEHVPVAEWQARG